jgi:transcriptional regulator GlxA family with amidase domain
MTPPKFQRIALLAYEGCMGLEIFGVADVLLVAKHVAHAMGRSADKTIEVRVVSLSGKAVEAAGGISLGGQRPRGKFDWLIVPGLEVVQATQWAQKFARLQAELAFIHSSFIRGTQIASVCVGSFLLAEAGLLHDRQVTTAWIMARELGLRYPQAKVNPHAVLLEDGGIVTSGAITATFDLALHLVKHLYGAEVASATARIALLPKARSSQAPYVDAQLIASSPSEQASSFSASVAQWLKQRLKQPYSLPQLAKAFHVSPRTLMRRIKAETGASPLNLLQQARVDQAKYLLQKSSLGIAQIVDQVGYSDVATFTRLFVRQVGLTPAQYRRG